MHGCHFVRPCCVDNKLKAQLKFYMLKTAGAVVRAFQLDNLGTFSYWGNKFQMSSYSITIEPFAKIVFLCYKNKKQFA